MASIHVFGAFLPPVKRAAGRFGFWGPRALLVGVLGCEPPVEVGDWRCSSAPLFIPPDGSPILPGRDLPVTVDWSTSFEDGFCGYADATGFCYSDPDATHRVVETPTHSGKRAAAFDITTDPSKDGAQTRCVREGLLPKAAVYGAWFYIPSGTTSRGNWNLMHFQGNDGTALRGLWDVSVAMEDSGKLRPFVRGFRGMRVIEPPADVELPTDRWFALDFRWLREATPVGSIGLYLDGRLVVEQSDIITDDSKWGQWYVGNLATDLEPQQSTIYVDDVTIRKDLDGASL